MSPASDLAQLNGKNTAGYLIALQVSKIGDVRAVEVYGDIVGILADIGAKYYSVIIHPFAIDSIWGSGNFELSIVDSTQEQKVFN